ncbi:hypothetical protein [Desulfosarcina widdelii]|uniref:hypothetical protein n=1 Tax=Desulfosarcina widdelii TaxID=947919 RepID=UPI0012D351E4|nr:hypothetical protein [Desulfosarcina widdelii]
MQRPPAVELRITLILSNYSAAKHPPLSRIDWRVFRLDGGVKDQDVLAEQVADLVLSIKAHSEEIFVNHSFSTDPSQGRQAIHHQECVHAGGL